MTSGSSPNPPGPVERWARIRGLVREADHARSARLAARNHAELIAAVRVEQRATDDLIVELDHLEQEGVLDEIGKCLSVIYGRADGC